jgi:riboflavin synthase
MFSGIIEEMGTVKKLEVKKNLAVMTLSAKKMAKEVRSGDSVAVNGACLTVTAKKNDCLTFDMMKETLDKTSLGKVEKKDYVNLERALKVSDRINGHFVSGHVDCMGKITDILTLENYLEIRITLSKDIAQYIVDKGSVTLDGVSLTVGRVRKSDFSVYIIPFTMQHTNLGTKKKGDFVNIEVDILARYVLNKDK